MRRRRISLHARLFWAFALVTLIAVTIPVYFFHSALYEDSVEAAGKEALDQAAFVGSLLDAGLTDEQLDSLFSAAAELFIRMTLADSAGNVVRDTHVGEPELSTLDNHNDRPEIESAKIGGSGISLRRSNTLGFDAVFAAVELESGGILRVAVPLAGIRDRLERRLPPLAAVMGGVSIFCLFLSAAITGRVRRHMEEMARVVTSISRAPGNTGQLRLRDVQWREMLPLARAVNHMADTIESNMAVLTDQHGQLETILDSMHEGVLVLGPSGNIRRWNRALAGLFPHIASAEGKAVIEVVPFPALQNRVEATLAADGGAAPAGSPEEAVLFEMPAGRFLAAHVSRPATRNDSLGAVIVLYNATEIMRLERVRRDFVSNVSHELRTPLTAIAGCAEVLSASDELTGDYKKFAQVIHKHAVSLSGVINDLLMLARIENTREAIARAETDAEPALFDAAAAVKEQAEAKHVAIRIELDPTPVLANAGMLTQVFRNLLENACRYSPQHGVVRVFSRREGDHVLFCVSDNGPGIPPEALPRIFERFYQVKKERNSGTAGIGLAVCKHIIERHHGRIWAESPYGEAATAMLFTLPAAVPEL